MASAEKTEIERIVKEEGIVLHLTMAEARALGALTWRVVGSPDRSPRGLIDGIRKALAKAVTGSNDQYEIQWAQPELACFEGGIGIQAKDYE